MQLSGETDLSPSRFHVPCQFHCEFMATSVQGGSTTSPTQPTSSSVELPPPSSLYMCSSNTPNQNSSSDTESAAATTTTMSVGDALTKDTTTAGGNSCQRTTATVRPKRQVRTGRVNCRWLYNQAQASRGTILIDTRPRHAFEEDSIPSAISIPPMPHCQTLQEVEAGMLEEQKYLFSSTKRKLRDVVLFGDAVKHSSASSSTSPKNDNNDNANKTNKTTNSSSAAECSSWLEQLERLIMEDALVTSIKVLCDGFVTFKYRYPFFTTSAILDDIMVVDGISHTGGTSGATTTTSRTQSGKHNLNYPNEILDGFLFLGNMWHAQSAQVVRHLGITHIVNASLDLENVFCNENVLYHEVKIKDRPEADISAFFDSTFAFIESAKRTHHGRVLVHCTQGISRSATLVVLYLMRIHQWSLVTAMNYAMACRGVVYPNLGFVKALMDEEFRLYGGNSLLPEEVDTLLQHQIPDRPIPLVQRLPREDGIMKRKQFSETSCLQCKKLFSLLEWKHRCSYCRKEFCSKCTSTRLAAISEREKQASSADEARGRGRRVCDGCVKRLWKINLPKPRKGLNHTRFAAKCKHLHVGSMSTFGKPVCLSFFEGTETQTIVDLIKIRFEVKENQIMDISTTETGEPVRDVASLPDETVVLISIGKAGNVQDLALTQQRHKNTVVANGNGNGFGRRYQILKEMEAAKNRKDLLILQQRSRFSSEGNMEGCMEPRTTRPDMRRSNSLHLEKSSEMLVQEASQSTGNMVLGGESKFQELWALAFPSIRALDRNELLAFQNPMLLSDFMLGISSVSRGAMSTEDLDARLAQLGHGVSERQLVAEMLNEEDDDDEDDED